ncbi:hypothetical protein CRV08_01970 [Halarcobacter ebronensis]|uniref:Mce/MlaD domain-containing protein n=1 Tax=Halarcobacter ebronensis TaxID=1462615 RepID=A0A4Q0YJ21_9BACT|nr:MlaD family protein [Halarcobacter ebronensis]RXJ70355.1 hypothetical protein CRV08_01970 [Halarcobacter ebronensis]
MENRAKYTTVGLFVLLFAVAMVLFILWLARYDMKDKHAKEYRVYTKTSVAGLNKNSIVEYKGLDIGIIKDIRINPENLEEIEILLEITKPELIKIDTFVTIESQGVTGNKLLEVNGGMQSSELLLPEKGKDFAVIPLNKSFFDKLTSSADSITQNIERVLNRFELLLNEKNLTNIEKLLKNSNLSSENLNRVLIKMQTLIDKSFTKTLNDLDKVIENDISASAKNINELSKNFNSVSLDIKELINNDVKDLIENLKDTTKSSKNIDVIIDKLETTLDKIDTTVENFNNGGGDMIFNTREINYGPGEKNEK